jgi:hypothetical protein
LDFLVDDVIEYSELVDTKAKLGPPQTTQALDTALRDLSGLVPQVSFERIAERRAMVGGQAPEPLRRFWRKDDLEAHAQQI